MVRVDEAGLARAAEQVITALAGPDAIVRDDQLDAVRALACDGRRALVVQATGWGKSAVYWISARAVRDAGAGPVLVVSPLLALMRDQVAAASRAGLRAVTLNSSNVDDWSALEAELLSGAIDVLLVSPERLASPRFADEVLAPLIDTLGLLVIDEAHCISSWGHDFRPDYQRIAGLLLANPTLPVLATTATANARVTADVAAQLGSNTYVQRGELARTSLHLSVVPSLSPIERYAWVDDALRVLPGSGIVYVLTVAEATRLTGFLASRGHRVAEYSGQLEPAQRANVEDALRANEIKAVVATSALGMGYDKPDLAFCIHVGSPSSPVDYYQQVGRAGRALDTAVVALLPAANDERLWEWFATASVPDPKEAGLVLDALRAAPEPVSVIALESTTGVRRSRIELLVKVLAVDGAVTRSAAGWAASGAPWSYDEAKYADLVASRRSEADLMRAYVAGARCLETLLRLSLDDLVAVDARCGRCSVCSGVLPAGLPQRPAPESIEAATGFLRGLDTVITPRKLWAGGMSGRSGRIAASVSVGEGRALAFADDPAWPDVAALLADTTPDAPAPDWLVQGMVAALGRWRSNWPGRPVAVASIPSTRRPVFAESLARAIAEIGHLDFIEPFAVEGPRPAADTAPAARARALESRIRLSAGAMVPSGPVLLVDDTLRTGWTMTIAGALLREAGTCAVLPLVAHQRP
ncbi:unannotated protein [freshwater metagenome]|uniref:DNA 3'-5' helicase n=1 Tax=freshwater metagenome TaxID=449393 RepID=A0A6J7EX69_9ZZZZ